MMEKNQFILQLIEMENVKWNYNKKENRNKKNNLINTMKSV